MFQSFVSEENFLPFKRNKSKQPEFDGQRNVETKLKKISSIKQLLEGVENPFFSYHISCFSNENDMLELLQLDVIDTIRNHHRIEEAAIKSNITTKDLFYEHAFREYANDDKYDRFKDNGSIGIKIIPIEVMEEDQYTINPFKFFSPFEDRFYYHSKDKKVHGKYTYNVCSRLKRYGALLKVFPIELANIIFEFAHSNEGEEFQLGICIGRIFLLFKENGVIIPKRLVRYASFCEVDSYTGYDYDFSKKLTKKEQEEFQIAISKIITRYNTRYMYRSNNHAAGITNKKKKKKKSKKRKKDEDSYVWEFRSSADFVYEIIETLGVKIQCYALQKYLQVSKENGTSQLIFFVNKELQTKFKIDADQIVFKTHVQLDEFVNKLFLIDPELEIHFKDEYNFLKKFDRYFWVKHFQNEKEAKWSPLMIEEEDEDEEIYEELECPFRNPLDVPNIRFLS